MASQLPNVWILRKVAESASKPCIICYKATTSVLITADSALTSPEMKKDFFYTCDVHLTDRNFAMAKFTPEQEAARKKKEELDREIEIVKKEYEEKLEARRKREKGWFGFGGSSKDKEAKDKDKSKEKDKAKEEAAKDEKEKEEKIKAIENKGNAAANADDGPRVFELHKSVHQMRVNKILGAQQAQQAKRTQERMRDPGFFPSVPTGNP